MLARARRPPQVRHGREPMPCRTAPSRKSESNFLCVSAIAHLH